MSEYERGVRAAAEALEHGVVVLGPVRGPDGIRRVREACRERVLALLPAPAEPFTDTGPTEDTHQWVTRMHRESEARAKESGACPPALGPIRSAGVSR